MKNKKLIIIMIIFLILILTSVTVYKFVIYNDLNEDIIYFKKNTFEKRKENLKSDDNNILDKEKYKDKIVTENKVSIDFNFFHKKESVLGTIYIGRDKYLYITNKNENNVFRASDIKFTTMYAKDYEYTNGLYVFLISEEKKLYCLKLEDNDISKVEVSPVDIELKVTNFVNVDFESDMYVSGNTLFVLSEDGNIYDAGSGIRYNEDTKSLYNTLYVFGDNTFSDVYGRMLHDENKNSYKIKYIFLTDEDNEFSGKNTITIITEDNRYLSIKDNPDYVYEYKSKVKEVKFNAKYPYLKDKLSIVFEDDYKVEFTARCNEYYCINEFVE